MEVIATRTGVFGSYRQPGERFSLTSKAQFSSRWMVEVGTSDHAAFERAQSASGNNPADRRDKITGERLASGGINEQIAIALEENRILKQRIVDLEAKLVPAKVVKVEALHPAKEDDKPDEADVDETPKVRVRRRST